MQEIDQNIMKIVFNLNNSDIRQRQLDKIPKDIISLRELIEFVETRLDYFKQKNLDEVDLLRELLIDLNSLLAKASCISQEF